MRAASFSGTSTVEEEAEGEEMPRISAALSLDLPTAERRWTDLVESLSEPVTSVGGATLVEDEAAPLPKPFSGSRRASPLLSIREAMSLLVLRSSDVCSPAARWVRSTKEEKQGCWRSEPALGVCETVQSKSHSSSPQC